MSLPATAPSVALLLAIATLFACLRLWRRWRHASPPRLPVRLGLLAAQPLLALLLYLGLFPPARPVASGTLAVFTANAAQTTDRKTAMQRITLPEASPRADAQRMPDLATALRKTPGVQGLHIIGAGLEPRDLAAARGYPLTFLAAPAPPGLVDLARPAQVPLGNPFSLHGRLDGLPNARVALYGPDRQRLQQTTADGNGAFSLPATARTQGPALWTLHIQSATGAPHSHIQVPIVITAPPPVRLVVLAGAPNPELKYLRRWAVDTGSSMQSHTATGAGMSLGAPSLRFRAETLAEVDVLLLDTRALQALDGQQWKAVVEAVRAGLGLLLRIDDTPSPRLRTQLRALGITLGVDRGIGQVQLNASTALRLHRIAMHADASAPLLHDAGGQPLGLWRGVGRGRVAVLPVDDTFKLVLTGHGKQHAALWSEVAARVARNTGDAAPPAPTAPWPVWQGERMALCGIAAGAVLTAPDGRTEPLAIDPATGPRHCAAFWPRQGGWHRLLQGQRDTWFHVYASNQATAWRARLRQDATQALVSNAASHAAAGKGLSRPGSAWPWLAAWLALAAALWWLERRLLSQPAH